ncbi:MAG: lipoyl(octanoyl) transferase LipB [Desulfosoma sp.]
MVRLWRLVDLGVLDYDQALQLQHRCVDARNLGVLDRDVFFLLEHPAVITCGRRGGTEHLCVPSSVLKAHGVRVLSVERGGSITYHGPGQLVGYPIVHLPSAGWKAVEWVTALEEVMIRTAARFGVKATRNTRNRGVWVGDKKLGSIGIAVRHGVSFHGFALNVNNSLEPFGWIHPCGLENVSVTSLALETGTMLSMIQVKATLTACAEQVLDVRFERTDLEALYVAIGKRPDASG